MPRISILREGSTFANWLHPSIRPYWITSGRFFLGFGDVSHPILAHAVELHYHIWSMLYSRWSLSRQ